MSDKPPKVFISYCHESPAFADSVLAFANQLRADGIEVLLDQFEPAPPQGWPLWMQQALQTSDFTLLIITSTYLQRFNKGEEVGGVPWEGHLVRNSLYATPALRAKLIPILFDPDSKQYIPLPLQGQTYHVITNWQSDGGEYEKLYRQLTNQPAVIKAVLGKLRTLPPRERVWTPPSTAPKGSSDHDRSQKGWSLRMRFAVCVSAIVGFAVLYDRNHPDHPLMSLITGFSERNARHRPDGARIDRFTREIRASFEEFPFIHSSDAEFHPTAKDAAEFISMPPRELPSSVDFPFPGSYVVRCKPKYTPARVTENRTANVSEILALPKGLSYIKTEEIDNQTTSLNVHFKHGHQEKLGAE